MDDLNARDPFEVLAAKSATARRDMGLQTMVVAPTRQGTTVAFILLSRAAHPSDGDLGAGEELLEHRCGVLDALEPARAKGDK